MVEKSNSRQHQILEQLLENKDGLSIDDLAKQLEISRAAVQQHFVALERDNLIKKKQLNKTGGRPVSLYELTERGINYFPKQYAWLSEIIMSQMLEDSDQERFAVYMQKLGHRMAEKLQKQIEGTHLADRVEDLARIMNELGFQVKTGTEAETGKPTLVAFNCVYHDLAQKHQSICEFDLSLMSSLLDKRIRHATCMAKGDCSCRFIVEESTNNS